MRGLVLAAALVAALPATAYAAPDPTDSYMAVCQAVSGPAALVNPEASRVQALGVQAWADHRDGQMLRLMRERGIPTADLGTLRTVCEFYSHGVVDTADFISKAQRTNHQ